MKTPFPAIILVALFLAVLSYFLQPLLSQFNPQQVTALFVLVGGVLTALIAPMVLKGTEAASTDETLTLYIGNLAYRANEHMVREHFEQVGAVQSVRLMKDKRTGKRKGFGFVEMSASAAKQAIKQLNDSEFHERTLKVRLAKDKTE